MKKLYSLIFFLCFFLQNQAGAQCSTAATVPYYESFEGITQSDEFPPCWTASNPSITCLTFTTGGQMGNKMAGFYHSPGGTNYFYSGLVHLNAGVTYSAGIFYKTVGPGSSLTWSNLNLSFGPNQSPVGLTSIAGLTGNLFQTTYTSLSNTFVVTSSGDYYISVSATSNGGGSDFYLYFDNLTVTAPCGIAGNSPTVSIAASSFIGCSGDVITYTVSGADLYNANSGGLSTATVYTFAPLASYNLQVQGTDTLSGCSSTASAIFTINLKPTVLAFAAQPAVCLGGSVTVSGAGSAAFYIWNHNQALETNLVVSPTVTTVYTVTGVNGNGCTQTATVSITVNPNPSFTVSSDPLANVICYGEPVEISASSNLSYQWSSPNDFLTGNPVIAIINAPTVFTVTGTDVNGCKSTFQYAMSGMFCGLGINENLGEDSYRIYPIPFYESFILYSGDNGLKNIEVVDIAGRVIKAITSEEKELSIDLSSCDKGTYYVRIRSEGKSTVMRIMKN